VCGGACALMREEKTGKEHKFRHVQSSFTNLKGVGKHNSTVRASTAPPITCDAVRYKPRSSAP
jgi:hypothetical protein